MPAGTGTVVPEDRPGCLLRQLALDRPNQILALDRVELHRLPVDHLVELRAAITVVIALGAASEVFVKRLVRVVEPVAGQVQRDGVVATHDPGEPLRRVDRSLRAGHRRPDAAIPKPLSPQPRSRSTGPT